VTDTRNRCDFSDTEEVTHLKPQVNAYLAATDASGHDVFFALCAHPRARTPVLAERRLGILADLPTSDLQVTGVGR